jgi:hypothetical protein
MTAQGLRAARTAQRNEGASPNNPAPLTVRSLPLRFTILFRLRTGPNVLIRAFATVLLTHALAFADMRLTLHSPGTAS